MISLSKKTLSYMILLLLLITIVFLTISYLTNEKYEVFIRNINYTSTSALINSVFISLLSRKEEGFTYFKTKMNIQPTFITFVLSLLVIFSLTLYTINWFNVGGMQEGFILYRQISSLVLLILTLVLIIPIHVKNFNTNEKQ